MSNRWTPVLTNMGWKRLKETKTAMEGTLDSQAGTAQLPTPDQEELARFLNEQMPDSDWVIFEDRTGITRIEVKL